MSTEPIDKSDSLGVAGLPLHWLSFLFTYGILVLSQAVRNNGFAGSWWVSWAIAFVLSAALIFTVEAVAKRFNPSAVNKNNDV